MPTTPTPTTPPEDDRRPPAGDAAGPADAPPGADRAEPASDGPQLLTFRLGEELFGCPLTAVREIVPARATTRLPGAPDHVLGILNLRGTLLTVLDVSTALARDGAAAAGDSADGHILIVEVDGRGVGCRVGAVRRVYPLASLVPLPADGGNGTPHGIVLGFGEAGDDMVAVLDLPALARQTLLFRGNGEPHGSGM